MSEEIGKKNIDQNKPEPDKSPSSKKGEISKASPKEKTTEEKLKEAEEKLLRSLAEIENQRRRFEKEIKDAFEFGSFNFAKENLATLENLQRAKEAIKNDEKLKDNKDLDKFLENINSFDENLLNELDKFLSFDDEIIYNFYHNNVNEKYIEKNEVSKIFKKFKI